MKELTIVPGLNEQVVVEYVVHTAAGSQKRRLGLNSNFTITGAFNTIERDTEKRVEVAVMGSRYTYRDPGLVLEKGDAVRVPFGSSNTVQTGVVVATDAPKPPVGYLKDVLSVATEWAEA